jgi:hypothetical protein
MLLNFLKIEKKEIIDLLFITIVLSFLFSISFFRFIPYRYSFLEIYVLYLIFLMIFYVLQLYFMKFVAYYYGFEIFLYQTYFDRYFLAPWDSISQKIKSVSKMTHKEKLEYSQTENGKIPMVLISVILFILTLGFLIYPSVYNYKYKRIPFRHFGKKSIFESEKSLPFLFHKEISDYRFSMSIFAGFIFYFLFALILKIFFSSFEFYLWFLFMIIYLAFISLIPIFGSSGYELFMRNNFAWLSTFAIFVFGFFSIFIFDNIFLIVIAIMFTFICVTIVSLWKKLM